MIRDLGAYGTVINNISITRAPNQERKMGLKNIHRNNA